MSGFQPINTVTPQASAGAAIFGAPDPDTTLDYKKLAQDQKQFDAGVGLRREEIVADDRRQNRTLADNQAGREHDVLMENTRTENENKLRQRVAEFDKNKRILELKFAQANAQERERLAPQLLDARKRSSNADAQLAAFNAMLKLGTDKFAMFAQRATNMRDMIRQTSEAERNIGRRAGMDALSRIAEDLGQEGQRGYNQYRSIAGTNLFLNMSDYGDSDYGFDLLKINDDLVGERAVDGSDNEYSGFSGAAKHFGQLVGQTVEDLSFGTLQTGPEAQSLATIDDNKVEQRSSEMIARYVARAISQQTGDKFVPEDIRVILDEMIKGGDNVGDQAAILVKMQKAGISPEVMKSTLLELSAAMDGKDPNSPAFNRIEISRRRDSLPVDSGQTMALNATLKLIDRMQSKARTVAAQIQSVDLDSMNALISYMERASSGGKTFKRDEMARLIPSMMGTNVDEDFRDSILGDASLGDIEKIAPENQFGFLNQQITSMGRNKSAISDEISDLEAKLEALAQGRSQDIGGLIEGYEGIKY